jgi:alpha-amylase
VPTAEPPAPPTADAAGQGFTGQNGTIVQYFHWYTPGGGTWWDTVAADATHLADLGVTAVWLPPAYKGQAGAYDVGYGVYDMYDLGEFDQKGTIETKYGSRAEYEAAIAALHGAGIQVYADVVMNHRMGADATQRVTATRVDGNDRNHDWGENIDIDAWTSFTFPGRHGAYSSFQWQWYHFDGVDWAQNLSDGHIWKFRGIGKAWDWEVDGENGNYAYLMGADLDMDHPEVQAELADWATWYVDELDLDGLRLDAVKHIRFSFFNDWLDTVRARTQRELFTVGEYWSYDLGKLTHFIDVTGGRMSLFDAPLHMNFYRASRAGWGSFDMRTILDQTLMSTNPVKAVTLVENHDTQPLQALESPVDAWFKPIAYALVLLREEGYPVVFYPDLHGATYTDRGITVQLDPVPGLDRLMQARQRFAYGPQHSYFDHWDVIGWTREGVASVPGSGVAVLVSDGPGGTKSMYVGTRHAGEVFHDFTGHRGESVTIDANGVGTFAVDGGSVSVWVR